MALFAGCSEGTPTVAPVRGFVEFDGKLLSQGKIMLVPASGRMGHGSIEPDGSFEISTFEADSGDGAVLGPANLAVYSAGNAPNTTDRYHKAFGGGGTPLLPDKFKDPDKSGLAFEVMADDNNVRIKLLSNGTGTVDRD